MNEKWVTDTRLNVLHMGKLGFDMVALGEFYK